MGQRLVGTGFKKTKPTQAGVKRNLALDDPLDQHYKPIKVEGFNTGLQIKKDTDVRIEGDLKVTGDISLEGGDINFDKVATEQIKLGDNTTIQSETTDLLSIESTGLVVSGVQQAAQTAVGIITQSGQDSKYALYNGATLRWTVGNDADDSNKLKIDSDNLTVGGNTKLTLDSSGNLTVTGNVVSSAGTLGAGGASALNDLSDVTYSSGDLTISSLDKIIADDFVIDSGASIELDSNNGNFVAKKAGTEFSATNSAYAGMILGYTYLHPTDGTVTHEIQNSMTVEDSTHQISFKTPPSEFVEIELSCFINVSSTDTNIDVGLSDNSTYNSIGGQFEYDFAGVYFTDDEVDDDILTVKWVLSASELASIGSSNTFYIGFSTAGATKTANISYGFRSSHGVSHPPFVIKATALPATIYTG